MAHSTDRKNPPNAEVANPERDATGGVDGIHAQDEVSAGPGDAGGRPKDRRKKRGGRGLFIALLIAGPLFMVLYWLLVA